MWTFVALVILGELGVNLGPLIAGAGIGGVALGFGAQSIVKDFLSGLFMLIEDQYGVGDVDRHRPRHRHRRRGLAAIDDPARRAGAPCGTSPTARSARVGNYSAAVVARRSSTSRSPTTSTSVTPGDGCHPAASPTRCGNDPEWGGDELIGTPRPCWGIQNLGASAASPSAWSVKTEPSMQWSVEREIRLRVKEALRRGRHRDPVPAADHLAARRSRTVLGAVARGADGVPGALRGTARPEARGRLRGPLNAPPILALLDAQDWRPLR